MDLELHHQYVFVTYISIPKHAAMSEVSLSKAPSFKILAFWTIVVDRHELENDKKKWQSSRLTLTEKLSTNTSM